MFRPLQRAFTVHLFFLSALVFFSGCGSDDAGPADPAGGGGGGGGPTAGATALDAIDEALENGDIGPTDALRYKVFAVFGDTRLPEEYRSDTPFEGSGTVAELAESWSTLPADVQDELAPFLLPPVAEGSWYDLQEPTPDGDTAAKAPAFAEVGALDGRVRIRFPSAFDELAFPAGTIKSALEDDAVWSRLVALMGREPLTDSGIDESYNGGDGRFDIYVVRSSNITSSPDLKTCYGWATPYSPGFFADLTGDRRRASYLVINADVARTEDDLRSTLAHEFMHVLNFAFDVYYTAERNWLTESTATWAEHFIYPNADTEQLYADNFLDVPEYTLTSLAGLHEYGGYLFWLFLADRYGDEGIVRRAWEQAESQLVLDAVDTALPGGFVGAFKEFAATNWNRSAFSSTAPYDIYRADRITDAVAVTDEKPRANPQQTIEVEFDDGGVRRLSAQYVHYEFADADTRVLTFANGYTFELKKGVPPSLEQGLGDETYYARQLSEDVLGRRQVIALVKQDGDWRPEPIDLTDVAFASFCQEAASESLEELVLIFVNAEHRDDEPAFESPVGEPPQLFTSNLGCGAWSGSASISQSANYASGFENYHVDVTRLRFERPTVTLDQIAAGAGQTQFDQWLLPRSAWSGGTVFAGQYEITDVAASWGQTAQSGLGTPTVCEEQGNGEFGIGDVVIGTFGTAPDLLATRNGSLIPSLYRSFAVQMAFLASGEPVMGVCSGDSPRQYTRSFGTALVGGYRNSEFGPLIVNGSGNRITESWSSNELSFTLDLTSQDLP